MARVVISLICCVLILAGCAASPLFGPVSTPGFPHLVEGATSESDGEILMFGPGVWKPFQKEFNFSGQVREEKGIIVITDKSILIQQWDESISQFSINERLSLSDITNVYLDTFGRNRLVIVIWDESNFHSFQYTSNNGTFIDQPKTESLSKLLQSKLNPALTSPPQVKIEKSSLKDSDKDYTEEQVKLQELKKLYDDGVITKIEYDLERQKVLDSF